MLEKVFGNLSLAIDPFATCRVADGWRLLLPGLNWVTLHFILEGEGELRFGSGPMMELKSGMLAVMPTCIEHAVQCEPVSHEASADGQGDPNAPISEIIAGPLDSVKMTIACGRIQVVYAGGLGLFEHLEEPIVLDFRDSPQMRRIFETMLDEYTREGPGSVAMMTAVMNQCLILVLRRASEREDKPLPWLSALSDERLARVIEHIVDNPADPHTVELLAEKAGMSRSSFAKHFEQCFARTPMDYVRGVRLRRGAQLLYDDGLSMEEVAIKVGYASRSHFSRAFSEHFGSSPSDYRKQLT